MSLPRPFALAALCSGLGLLLAAAPTPGAVYPVALLGASQGDGHGSALLLGSWQDGRWTPPAKVAPLLTAGRDWRMQALGTAARPGVVLLRKGGAALPGDAPCPETVFLDFQVPAGLPQVLLTAPALNVRPRPVEVLPTQSAVYRQLVRAELVRAGVASPVVEIGAVVRTDLDGDGTLEVIVEASHFRGQQRGTFAPPPSAEAGDYSLLLLRWVRNGRAQTTVLAKSVYPKIQGDRQVPTRYGLAGVADLNGDGPMELVVQDAYYEGDGAAVLEWSPGAGVRERLNEGCGA